MKSLNLAETIRTLRESRRWSQEKLAQKAEVSREYIKSLESGATKHPRTDKLMRIAEALEVTVQELFRAAGYIKEKGDGTDAVDETPQQVIDHIKLHMQELEKLLKKEE